MAYAKSYGELVESDDRGITVTLLKTADVLLAEARNLGKLLLRQAPPLADSPNIPTDQSAHVHAQRSADYILEVYQLKYVHMRRQLRAFPLMQFTSEQHLAVAKKLREDAKLAADSERGRLIKHSNNFLVLAVLAAKNRGGISTTGFDFIALTPDWRLIDNQVARLEPAGGKQAANVEPPGVAQPAYETGHAQVRQLVKQALETPTPEALVDFLRFTTKFRRLAVWNARMAYIQRPGACAIATEYEWQKFGRYVLPDAVPIIILWPFSPIRFVYELADTGPPIDRDGINDPFAVKGEFRDGMLTRLLANLKKQKKFKIAIEARRQGFSYAGSAAAQGVLSIIPSLASSSDTGVIGEFARGNAASDVSDGKRGVPTFRVTVNDRLGSSERFVTVAHELGHIFCGHLGAYISQGSDDEESGWPDRRSLGKNEKEVEAEAVAYLIAERAGLITRSATYLTPYAQRANMGTVDVDLIVRAAARIERLAKIQYGSLVFDEKRHDGERNARLATGAKGR